MNRIGMRMLSCALCGVLPLFATHPAQGVILETWESQPLTDPFTGSGDLTWTGDLAAWNIASATWPPTPPSPDFAGERSLRSSNHRSTADPDVDVVETVVTDISLELDFSKPMEWSVFFSGNSASISTDRRADFILLSDNGDVGVIEDPNDMMNGYKLTLWDPLSTATSNVPPSSHEDLSAAESLDDSLTLWRVDETDDRWRVVGAIEFGDEVNLNEGWNIKARLDPDGTWSIGYANGVIGQDPVLISLGVDPGAPNPLVFSTGAYGGVAWLAPNNSTNDHTDFGFDNFRVAAVPEPSSITLLVLGVIGATLLRKASRRR